MVAIKKVQSKYDCTMIEGGWFAVWPFVRNHVDLNTTHRGYIVTIALLLLVQLRGTFGSGSGPVSCARIVSVAGVLSLA